MVVLLIQPLPFWPAMVAVAVGSGWFATRKSTEFFRGTLEPPEPSAAPWKLVRVPSGDRSPVRPPPSGSFATEYTGVLYGVEVLNIGAVELLGSSGAHGFGGTSPVAHNQLSPPINTVGPVPVAHTPPGTLPPVRLFGFDK